MVNTHSPAIRVLIIDDEKLFHLALKETLDSKMITSSAYHCDEAFTFLKKQAYDIILLDIQMRKSNEGLEAIPKIKELCPEAAIIMTSGLTDYQTVKQAMKLGAFDYITKTFEPEDLFHTVEQALENRRLKETVQRHAKEVRAHQNQHALIGVSPAIESLRRIIEKVKKSRSNVLISGETGTGKEVVARQIRSSLSDGTLEPFITVDSATIQQSTAESVLFGHEKGAFTGADSSKRGLFEEANGGTIYFDEIGNMPLSIQLKLLRVLQEKEVMRMGASQSRTLDFRVISATNVDLMERVEKGEFQLDVLQRLNVIPIEIPPLRERTEDIPLLIQHFCKLHGQGERQIHFLPETVSYLLQYSWPGNVRELSNLVAYLTTMADQPEIEIADLPPRLRELTERSNILPGQKRSDQTNFYHQVESFEASLLRAEYAKAAGNVSRLALDLGMDRSHLYTKLKQYGIHVPRKKSNITKGPLVSADL